MVVAAGPWAGRLAATAGVELPIVPVRHQYFVTQPVPGIAADLPERWLQPWCLSWLVAFPTLLLVMPTVRRITGLFVEAPRG